MISKQELEQAIRECEEARVSYQTCEKLATFYTVYDHLYQEDHTYQISHDARPPSKILDMAGGKDDAEIWRLIEEMVDAVQVLLPKLYNSFIEKLTE